MSAQPKTPTKAGGFILAVSIIAGAVGGTVAGQPSAGLVLGVAAGTLVAILIWLGDRKNDS